MSPKAKLEASTQQSHLNTTPVGKPFLPYYPHPRTTLRKLPHVPKSGTGETSVEGKRRPPTPTLTPCRHEDGLPWLPPLAGRRIGPSVPEEGPGQSRRARQGHGPRRSVGSAGLWRFPYGTWGERALLRTSLHARMPLPPGCSSHSLGWLRTEEEDEATRGCPLQRCLPALWEMMRKSSSGKRCPIAPHAGPGDVLTACRKLSPGTCPAAASPFAAVPTGAKTTLRSGSAAKLWAQQSPPVLLCTFQHVQRILCLSSPSPWYRTGANQGAFLLLFMFSSTFS